MNQGRTIPIVAAASASTFGLFYLMQALIAADVVDVPEETFIPDFNSVLYMPKPPKAHEIERLVKPKPVEPKPVQPKIPTHIDTGGFVIPTGPAPKAPTDMGTGDRIDLGAADGEQIPIVRVEPSYPQRALKRGIEGWTIVQFTVSPSGTVENPTIVDAEPKGYFEAATLKAVGRFKYKPRIIDGRAVPTPGVRYRMVFSLDANQ